MYTLKSTSLVAKQRSALKQLRKKFSDVFDSPDLAGLVPAETELDLPADISGRQPARSGKSKTAKKKAKVVVRYSASTINRRFK